MAGQAASENDTMEANESKRHHFVPKFLLRGWLTRNENGHNVLNGYYWDERKNEITCHRAGLSGFCWEKELLALQAHQLGRDAIERKFFGEIDDKGAKARKLMLATGPEALCGDERCNFARLLMSLEARRPKIVGLLRSQAGEVMIPGLNEDTKIQQAFAARGIVEPPSAYYERETGTSLEDHALAMIQRLVDNKEVGFWLINSFWHLVRLRPCDGSFVLGDRPLIRSQAYNHPRAAWILPLAPNAAFIAVDHKGNLQRIMEKIPARFAKRVNAASAGQAERFVFTVVDADRRWFGKYLNPNSASRRSPSATA